MEVEGSQHKILSKTNKQTTTKPHKNKTKQKNLKAKGMCTAQMVEYFPSMLKALGSIPSTKKNFF
jgi:hypothetical protein